MENNFEKENEQLETQNEQSAEVVTKEATSPKGTFPWWIIAVCAVVLVAIITTVVLLLPKYADYTVKVVDEIGNPMSNVMVKLTDGDGDTKTKITDKDGTAVFVEARVGKNNTVKLEKGFSDATIITSQYTLDKKTTELRAIVCDETKIQPIYGDSLENAYAYNVGVGTYNIPGDPGKTTYLVFSTNFTGTFKVSFTSDDSEMTVGYYGIPMFVQSNHRGEGAYDGKTFEFVVQDTATPYVIGLNCVIGADAALTIERIGDAPFDPKYAPKTTVPATEEFKEFSTGALTALDIASTSLSVELRDDGYYYTNTGKRVYIRISSTSQYLDASIALIAGCVDDNVGQNIGGDVYDENGEFVGKYSYNDMIAAYYEHVDANGVYPLTEELANAIKVHGESTGWWNPNAANFLFSGKPYNAENAWLFLCCTEQ